jgi:YkoY family integral membrane protein
VPFDVQLADFAVIGSLVLLEALLSADNALVLAILVLGLPREQQRQALRYGILGAFFFRIVAIFFAAQMIEYSWVKLVGGAYLMWLSYAHFFRHQEGEARSTIKPAKAWLGLSVFWTTVIKVELKDIVFAVDSILVAVAMSPKLWVIITGGVLGIIAMRLVIGQLLTLVQKYPALVDGAFVIIAWVAVKLFVEYANQMHWISFEIHKEWSLGIIVVIFAASYLIARKQGPKAIDEEATRVIKDQDN